MLRSMTVSESDLDIKAAFATGLNTSAAPSLARLQKTLSVATPAAAAASSALHPGSRVSGASDMAFAAVFDGPGN